MTKRSRELGYQPSAVISGYSSDPDPTMAERRATSSPLYYGAESWWVHQSHMRQFGGETRRVLELGAGVGAFTPVLVELGHHVTVSDLSPFQIDRNREEIRRLGFTGSITEWKVADILDLPFGDQTFDVVTCVGGALSHVVDGGRAAMGEMVRVLRPGGTIITSVVPPTLSGRNRKQPGVMGCGGFTYRTYNTRALSELMLQSGVEPIHFSAASLRGPTRLDFFTAQISRETGEEAAGGEHPLLRVRRERRIAIQLALLNHPGIRSRYITVCKGPDNVDVSPSFLIGVGRTIA